MNGSKNSITRQIDVPGIPITTSASEQITSVHLNLYDLGGCSNACVHSIGFAFYHCAVQTHSAEYGYMGHPYPFTGLYKTSKYDSRFRLYRLRQSIEVGRTWFSEKEIDRIVNDLRGFYLGWDYQTTTKNSIHFAQYLLDQLSHGSQFESMKFIQLPGYVDRGRRLTATLACLQIFDREKEIAEINILYFLYMKYQGDVKQICAILQCNTLEKFKRMIKFLEQGIEQKRLTRFPAFASVEMKNATEYFSLLDRTDTVRVTLTLTDVFHQFDTITLRGRTSIDRYLNIQPSQLPTDEPLPLPNLIQRDNRNSSQNQQQGRSLSASDIFAFASPSPSTVPVLIDPLANFEQLHMRTAIPIGKVLRLQETPNPDLPLTELHLMSNGDRHSLSLHPTRQRKRKLPRDLEFSDDLYTITPPRAYRQNYTNNSFVAQSEHQTDSSV